MLNGLLTLVWVVGTIIGIIFVIRPSKRWAVYSTRMRSLGMLVGVFFLVPVLGALTTKTPATAARDKPVATGPAPGATQTTGRNDDIDRGEVVNAQFVNAFTSCDTTAAAAMSEYKTFDNPVSVYEAFQKAKYGCHDSYSQIVSIKVPKFDKRETREAYTQAADKCGSALSMKSYAFDRMSKVIDGDMRPSAVSEARGTLETANEGLRVCAISLMAASDKAGAKLTLDSLRPVKN